MHDDDTLAEGSRPGGGAKAAGNATRYRGTGRNVGRTTVGRRLNDSGAAPASRDNIRPPRATTVKKKKRGSAAGVPKATGNAQKARTRAGGGTAAPVTGVTNRTTTAGNVTRSAPTTGPTGTGTATRVKKKKIATPTTTASRVKKKKRSS